ncbi:unnamed protein product [Tuber aestivum]|uniref:Uncharacterized protein n=1 Tax=Tuber aestivum TaxID=59557 RepID=A0A292PN89_9PEZI|nr:unnamed protein product [Tuber aestivum]
MNLHPPLAVTILGENMSEPRFARWRRIDLEEVVQTILLPVDDTTVEPDTEQHSQGVELGRVPGWRCFDSSKLRGSGGRIEWESLDIVHLPPPHNQRRQWISAAQIAPQRALSTSQKSHLCRPLCCPPVGKNKTVPLLSWITDPPPTLPPTHRLGGLVQVILPASPAPNALHKQSHTHQPNPRNHKNKPLHCAAKSLKALLASSRRKNTTITSLLISTTATATLQKIAVKFDKLTSPTPINPHRYLASDRIQEVAIGEYLASLRSEFSRSPQTPSTLFSIEREHTAKINDPLDAGTAGVDRVLLSPSGGAVGPACAVGVRGGGLVLCGAGCQGAVETRVLETVLDAVRRGAKGIE